MRLEALVPRSRRTGRRTHDTWRLKTSRDVTFTGRLHPYLFAGYLSSYAEGLFALED